jgi:hypothetical protein
MRNPRYKKLPGIDHGSANDSPAKYLENAADPESFAPGVTKETTPLSYMVPGQVAQNQVAGQNTAMMGTPLVPPPPLPKKEPFIGPVKGEAGLMGKVVGQQPSMIELEKEYNPGKYQGGQAAKVAHFKTRPITKKGYYKKK